MGSQVRIAVAQINCTVGDIEGNARRILAMAERAAAAGAQIMLTPELSLAGYPPEDLLLRPSFYAACAGALERLAAQLAAHRPLHVLVGHPLVRDGRCYNAASVLAGGRPLGTYCKRELPNYDVFDEQRYFAADDRPLVFAVGGTRFGVNICEDTWLPAAPRQARAAGAEVLLVLNGSPFHLGKQDTRVEAMRANVSAAGLALVFCNLVGGQDELVFDGASFALRPDGTVVAQAPQFDEALLLIDCVDGVPQPGPTAAPADRVEQAYRALVLGVRDYLGKNGFPAALIGLSGGIDSALTLAIAVDALGAQRVRAVMMPSPYTRDISWLDSRAMVAHLGVRYDELPIKPVLDAFLAALAGEFRALPWDATEENIQARIRGTLLMALSNKHGALVLTTGNKSEMAVGYCTLYGDMAGGFAVIKDIRKTLVYELARWRNAQDPVPVIPPRIIARPPSAELRPDQLDQDSLPPYEVLDAIIERYMERGETIERLVAAGLDEREVRRVVRLIRVNEYKRRQAPIGVRITHRAFGRDWRYPVTNRFREEAA